ncbi:MAG TPA: HNH endonuclease signature motif containing protein [Tepidisphaeraceae bacterium]|jgi:hypothetical protein|nr:HNH endonuclease signature motif containing protein [Tepidisphaeraceae bacterium]
MSDSPSAMRSLVIVRAHNRCEYCQLAQAGQEAAFHIDHIDPRVAGGATTEDNLALACVSCSLHKAAKQIAIDPQTGEEIRLYHPRTDIWASHFEWRGERIVGKTAVGRATVLALKMNRPLILAIRKEEMVRGRHPAS